MSKNPRIDMDEPFCYCDFDEFSSDTLSTRYKKGRERKEVMAVVDEIKAMYI